MITLSLSSTTNEPYLSKPSEEWSEAEALQVLNDSPWAHTISTTTQNFGCDHEHPAYPGTFSEEFARYQDSLTLTSLQPEVRPDSAQYLVRIVSVKPIQAAAGRLATIDQEKWAHYADGEGLPVNAKPTNLVERWYNPADEITIVVVLKHPGNRGESFRDYAFPRKNVDGSGMQRVWPCAAVKTANGVATAVTGGPVLDEGWNSPTSITWSFPSTQNGKSLISQFNEKLEFRMVVNQHVFETTFYVNPNDVFDLDGTETVLHVPRVFDEVPVASHP